MSAEQQATPHHSRRRALARRPTLVQTSPTAVQLVKALRSFLAVHAGDQLLPEGTPERARFDQAAAAVRAAETRSE